MKKEPALYEDGELICPHCRYPLFSVENRMGEYECFLCGGLIDKLTDEVMRKMLDDFPDELLREWQIEMKITEEEEPVVRGRRKQK